MQKCLRWPDKPALQAKAISLIYVGCKPHSNGVIKMFDELNAKFLFGAFGKLPGLSITKKRYELNERE